FDRLYREEKQNAQLAILFTLLAIIIATLGLFGLTSFTTEQRTKEIGVRKAMGSSSLQVIMLLVREISILIMVSTLIAWPVAWFVLNNWLSNFYYSIPLSPIYFLLGFLVALGIALLTVSYQALKAARTNPATALRYE
ncbi:MAG: FtsX-like permease family protein, partial [Bacteroidales bacterium]